MRAGGTRMEWRWRYGLLFMPMPWTVLSFILAKTLRLFHLAVSIHYRHHATEIHATFDLGCGAAIRRKRRNAKVRTQ